MRTLTFNQSRIFLLILFFAICENASAQILRRYCPPNCPPQNYCPPAPGMGQGADDGLADPNQFLDNSSVSPEVNPNLSVPQSDANLFAANPQAGELGGLGQSGYIAGNQFISGASFSGASYGNPGDPQGFTVPIAGGDRRVKLSDQFSPFPATRIFYNYHLFGNAGIDVLGNDIDINRSTFGFERSFFSENASIEFRIPIQSGVGKDQNLAGNGAVGQRSSQLGNIAISTKLLLSRDQFQSYSVGLATLLPTAPDADVFDGTDQIFKVANETVSIIPFVAANFTPNQQTWITFYSQADFSANGDSVSSFVDSRLSSPYSATPLLTETFNQQHLLSLDMTIGRWLYQNPNAPFLRGFATFFELHYTTTMNDADSVTAGNVDPNAQDVVTNGSNRLDILDTTVGIRAQLGESLFVTAAYVAPLRTGVEKSFDSEFNLNISRYFGGRNAGAGNFAGR